MTEREQIQRAFQSASAQYSAQTVIAALVLWKSTSPSQQASLSQPWLNKAVALMRERRSVMLSLARAYFRLSRALVIGSTVGSTATPGMKAISLAELRFEFQEVASPLLEPAERKELLGSYPTTRPAPVSQDPSINDSGDDAEADRILVDEIARLDALEKEIEKAAEDELRTSLQRLGGVRQQRAIDKLDDELAAREYNKELAKVHDEAGLQQAAAFDRVVRNGSRSHLWLMTNVDKKVIGYVRVSKTGTPCGWCAMLISRGPVYKSERSALYGSGAASFDDGDKYHDNCNCDAVAIFSKEEFASSALYDLNREYKKLWPEVTKGLGGKDALSAWRRFIREEAKGRAQEDAATNKDAQEA